MGMSLVVQVFGYKLTYLTSLSLDLVMALQDESGNHQNRDISILWEP